MSIAIFLIFFFTRTKCLKHVHSSGHLILGLPTSRLGNICVSDFSILSTCHLQFNWSQQVVCNLLQHSSFLPVWPLKRGRVGGQPGTDPLRLRKTSSRWLQARNYLSPNTNSINIKRKFMNVLNFLNSIQTVLRIHISVWGNPDLIKKESPIVNQLLHRVRMKEKMVNYIIATNHVLSKHEQISSRMRNRSSNTCLLL